MLIFCGIFSEAMNLWALAENSQNRKTCLNFFYTVASVKRKKKENQYPEFKIIIFTKNQKIEIYLL